MSNSPSLWSLSSDLPIFSGLSIMISSSLKLSDNLEALAFSIYSSSSRFASCASKKVMRCDLRSSASRIEVYKFGISSSSKVDFSTQNWWRSPFTTFVSCASLWKLISVRAANSTISSILACFYANASYFSVMNVSWSATRSFSCWRYWVSSFYI